MVKTLYVVQLLVDFVVVEKNVLDCVSLPDGKDRDYLASGLNSSFTPICPINDRLADPLFSLGSFTSNRPCSTRLLSLTTFLKSESSQASVFSGVAEDMDTYIDGRFERLEKALANLIDSVTKYHPSTVYAKELDIADNELSKGLEEGKLGLNMYIFPDYL